MILSASELATVLAALRYWQRRAVTLAADSSNPVPASKSAAPEFFVEHPPLDAARIDALCERLNTGGPSVVHVVVAERPEDTIEGRFHEAHAGSAAAELALGKIKTGHPEWDAAVIALELLD